MGVLLETAGEEEEEAGKFSSALASFLAGY